MTRDLRRTLPLALALCYITILSNLRGTTGLDELGCVPLEQMPKECSHIQWGDPGTQAALLLERGLNATGGSWYNISNGTVYQTGLETHNRLGNALSPYWFARALAWLAGYNYKMLPVKPWSHEKDWFTSPHFLRYLPTSVPRNSCADVPNLIHMCQEAHNFVPLFPHEAPHGWPRLWQAIQTETQAAFAQWSRVNNYTAHVFQPDDVVIQDRCDQDVLLAQRKYGPPPFRYYDALKGTKARNIYVLSHDNRRTGRPFYPCRALHGALCAHIASIAPSSVVHTYGSENIIDMWVWMMNAPVFYKSLSTFSLWSGVANTGHVYSMPLFVAVPEYDTKPYLGPRWHWVDVPVLNTSVANLLQPPGISTLDLDRILHWLLRT